MIAQSISFMSLVGMFGAMIWIDREPGNGIDRFNRFYWIIPLTAAICVVSLAHAVKQAGG